MTMSISPKYGVEFEELAGSPKIRHRKNGASAMRMFRVTDWTKASDFAKELIGEYGAVGVVPVFSLPIPFPGYPNLLVTDLDIDPFDEQSPAGLIPSTLGDVMNVYPGGAKITAVYQANFDATGGGIERPDGTTLVIDGDIGNELYPTPGRVWRWDIGGSPLVDPDTVPGVLVPTGDFTMTWGRIPLPPWTAMETQRGKVNAATFNRCAAGTLLFVGSRYRRMFQYIQSTELWEMTYHFRQITKTRNDGTKVGWNYQYREQSSGGEHWHKILNLSGNPPYKEDGDFQTLFQFATS